MRVLFHIFFLFRIPIAFKLISAILRPMDHNILLFSIFLIFTGAAVLSTAALYTRQSLLVAYMMLGILLGPWGLKWVADARIISDVGEMGIIFLLFLLGLHLQPQSLLHVLKKVSIVALASSIIFLGATFGVLLLFGYAAAESLIIAAALIFSSTIIGLKLLPTTVLHHQHTGELMIGVLLIQDLIAILLLLVLKGADIANFDWFQLGFVLLMLPVMVIFAFVFERFILRKLFRKFDRIREYMFLLAIAWCLSLSQAAEAMGLSAEIGAFVAGVSIASSPIAFYIAESLKPVRDFFLVLFFFSIGARFDLGYFSNIAVVSAVVAAMLLILKPIVFRYLFGALGEPPKVGWEVGMRLGQASEFSILVAYIAIHETLLSAQASALVMMVTMLTFVVSSYLVVMRYPTPVSMSDKLRRD
jgi:Kef-type K+ transport system membrane component KefB